MDRRKKRSEATVCKKQNNSTVNGDSIVLDITVVIADMVVVVISVMMVTVITIGDGLCCFSYFYYV